MDTAEPRDLSHAKKPPRKLWVVRVKLQGVIETGGDARLGGVEITRISKPFFATCDAKSRKPALSIRGMPVLNLAHVDL